MSFVVSEIQTPMMPLFFLSLVFLCCADHDCRMNCPVSVFGLVGVGVGEPGCSMDVEVALKAHDARGSSAQQASNQQLAGIEEGAGRHQPHASADGAHANAAPALDTEMAAAAAALQAALNHCVAQCQLPEVRVQKHSCV